MMRKAENNEKKAKEKYVVVRRFLGEKTAEEVVIQMLRAHAEVR
ncbi:MAG: hypothetical protein PHO41_09735 [Eubacteriales bacterium]|nr:hypothetical protein [Eubacteriales bacterium]